MRFFRGLQAKLIAAFVALAVVSLGVSGGVFVRLSQDNQQQQALDRVAAQTGPVYAAFLVRQFQGDSPEALADYARESARTRDLRILLTDRARMVLADTAGRLQGHELVLVPTGVVVATGGARPFSAFEVRGGGEAGLLLLSPEPGFDLRGLAGPPGGAEGRPAATTTPANDAQRAVASDPARITDAARTAAADATRTAAADAARTAAADATRTARGSQRLPQVQYQLVFAVPRDDLTEAWLGLLPGLGVAAGIALPVAVLLAVLLARYVTGPLRGLTAATAAVAEGRFDVDIPAARRRDEVGQLAGALAGMTARVGDSQAQVRALIADVSHNLKTPLTPILGFSRALATGQASEPEDVARMGSVIHEEAERLAVRLDDLLYLGELESGQAVLQARPTDLSALLAAATRRTLATGLAAGVRVETAIPPGIEAMADSPKLERAIENLLDNARKYTPAGGTITVFAARAGGGVLVEVANTAEGVDPAELPRFFERFYRSRGTAGPRVAGSGLGLPIARDIAALHGGTLEATYGAPTLRLRLAVPTARR